MKESTRFYTDLLRVDYIVALKRLTKHSANLTQNAKQVGSLAGFLAFCLVLPQIQRCQFVLLSYVGQHLSDSVRVYVHVY